MHHSLTTPRSALNHLIQASPIRLALPIATYPAIALTQAHVSDLVTNAQAQADGQAALRERYPSPFALSAMDLSPEAEAFGCPVHLARDEVPTVIGKIVNSHAAVDRLAVPCPGEKRTAVPLETVRLLARLPGNPFVLGGCIGPFTLASRLTGVSEALEMTVTDPSLLHRLLEKCVQFLSTYLRAFQEAGARGALMAEPSAGLLSPRALAGFSTPYIRTIAAAVDPQAFTLVLHNCAAKLVHLKAILEAGLAAYHFGAPMDLPAALKLAPPDVLLCGNLDPTAVFGQAKPELVFEATSQLLDKAAGLRNLVISSGCDLPASTPLANITAFYEGVRSRASLGPF